MKDEIEKQEDGTISIKITIPAKDVEKKRQEVIDELAKRVSLPGFRKGSVPPKIAREKLNKEAINEELLKKILPDAYIEAVKKHNFTPIVNPKIHIQPFEEGTDLAFVAQTCQEPEVDLQNYKDEIQKITAKSKIIIPGKEQEQKVDLAQIIEVLIKSTKVTLSKLLIENETSRLLSQLLDEIKTLGLSLEQYLSSKGINAEDLKHEYQEKAEKDLKLEFLLRKIADEEKVQVEQKDIDEALNQVKDEKQKAQMKQNAYLLSAIIRQQKTLDFLSKI